ncbi:MAG TPA: protein kinase [Vicinamibacterales bacterium]|nr:protein kinase [Vicinamibacterales bacterium]
MPLTPGSSFGAYRIVDKLGEGGMGAVYRARDTKLNREVALKVLPELFADDPDRLARFTREAQVLASLNHPNIAAIYGLEGTALVMELVDGADLSALIARGPMSLADALPVAKQIADALEAAHEQGIVHRDLKPGNIKVRPDGTVKVLDFGLAKALTPDSGSGAQDSQNSPTLTARATQMGMILGTAAYMSPEQARGKAVDRRADIWAFGVVLYEMLTGKRAFEGDDISITLANVLKDEPKWNALPADLPAPLARLLRRCLEKEPKRRLSSIGDARLELEEGGNGGDGGRRAEGTEARGGSTLFSRLWPALAGVVITAAVAAAIWPRGGTPSPASAAAGLQRISVMAPPGEAIFPDSTGIAISPDGTMVAYIIGTVSRSETELWVRSIDSLTPRKLETDGGPALPFWSPDSKRIGYFTNTKLKTIAATGGRPEALWDTPGARGGVWTAGNEIIFAPDAGGPLFKISASGGQALPITKIDPALKEYSHRFPTLLPDGRHFLYASVPGKNGRFDIYAGSLDDSSRTLIGPMEAAPVYADPGWLLYARQGVLAAVAFNAQTLKTTGEPILLEDEPASILEPSVSFTAGRSVSVSSTGALAYYSTPSTNTIATWFDTKGIALGALNVPAGHYESATISPDGRRAILVKSTSPSESSLWLVDLARGGAVPLSTGAGRNDSPVWAPDGSRVIWGSDRDGQQQLYIRNVNDGTPERLFYSSEVVFKGPVNWSPDGKWIILVQLDAQTAQNVWLLDASGTVAPTLLAGGPARQPAGRVSPDNKWLAFPSDETGRFQMFIQPFPGGGRRTQVSEKGGVFAFWSRDGRRLLYVGDDLRTVWEADVKPGTVANVGPPRQLCQLPGDIVSFTATPDLQRLLAISPERSGTGSATVVQNWRAALNKK